MKRVNLMLEIETWGSVYTRILEIEDQRVDIDYDSERKIHFVELSDYAIEGTLDIFYRIKGRDGANEKLKIFVDKEKEPRYEIECTIEGVVGKIRKSLDI
jgi:hypothetical protein